MGLWENEQRAKQEILAGMRSADLVKVNDDELVEDGGESDFARNEEELDEQGPELEGGLTQVIQLNTPKDIKSEDNIESLDKADYAKYGFIIFCILIGVLLILRNKKRQKKEII